MLSMPEQQLVEIACALGSGARIVIMDEPTASLTQKEQHLLVKVVRDLRESGVGVIYTSHRLEEFFALADRVTVLRDGESVGTNAVDDLTEAQMIRLMVGREVEAIYPPGDGEMGEVVLSIKSLSCVAGGVGGVDLEVRAGEIVGLAGLVGAGRTELARVLFGITPADGGGGALVLLLAALAVFAPNFFEWQPWGALAAALAAGAVMGALNGVLVAVLKLPSIVVTLATLLIWQEVIRLWQKGRRILLAVAADRSRAGSVFRMR